VNATASEMNRKARVTHVEVRRVQNGYVVMAMDYSDDYRHFEKTGARASFVAKDEEEVKLIIGNILASAEMEWLPTVDLPMIAMRKGVHMAPGENCPELAAPQAAGMLASRNRLSP
jgi:hypothetical protein